MGSTITKMRAGVNQVALRSQGELLSEEMMTAPRGLWTGSVGGRGERREGEIIWGRYQL